MSTIKLANLKKVGKELNELLGIEPPIDIKAGEDELKAKIIEAADLLEEDDDLSAVTQMVVDVLTKKEETEEEAPKDLIADVESCEDLKELKAIAKDNDVFVIVKKGLNFQKDVDKLKAKMLEELGVEAAPEEVKEEKSKAAKKENAPKPKKEAVVEYTRMDGVCEALKEAPKSIEEWVEKADELMEEKGKEAKFCIRYVIKMAEHFDFGVEVPTK